MAKRKIARDERLNHAESEDRADREMDDREIVEDRELTDRARLEEFQMNSFRSILPDIPDIDGYHVCWLTTDNPRDTLHSRKRWGYEPIEPHDVPGWGEDMSMKTGDYEGLIAVNEMVAMKISLRLYHQFMLENHYHAPNHEEEALSMATKSIEDQASQIARAPVSFELEDGQQEIGGHIPPPQVNEW